jgi:ribokinase
VSTPSAVVGQLARDVVLVAERMPEVGAAVDVWLRREQLGGNGANQVVALARFGVTVALVAVAGDDETADHLLAQARHDGIDVAAVIRRPGAETALVVELLEPGGRWRYLQHLPEAVLLAESNVDAAGGALAAADAVVVQLQQPPTAALAAARRAHDAGRLVVLDGASSDGDPAAPGPEARQRKSRPVKVPSRSGRGCSPSSRQANRLPST